MRLLDRYLLRSFLTPFLLCELGFLGVWLIYDLSINFTEFVTAKVPIGLIGKYYATQFPAIVVLTMPIGLLLSLLYTLTRLSQSKEIISMLGAGRSLERILAPLLLVGLTLTGVSTFLNYRLAPKAEARRETALADLELASGKFKKVTFQPAHLFANRAEHRLWYIERLPVDLRRPLLGVQVICQDASGAITEKIYSPEARFEPDSRAWLFSGGVRHSKFNAEGDVTAQEFVDSYRAEGFSETPWRIASSSLRPDYLSVPELRQYLEINSDFSPALLAPYSTYLQYRWAIPWACFIIILMGGPLGIVNSRRSVMAGTVTAIFLFFATLLIDNLFRALGRGNRISPELAAWGPIVLFASIGFLLLRIRSLNLDRFPRSGGDWWRIFTQR